MRGDHAAFAPTTVTTIGTALFRPVLSAAFNSRLRN